MATHSSVRAWRIPGTGEPGGLPSLESHRVGHDWSDLAAAYCIHASVYVCIHVCILTMCMRVCVHIYVYPYMCACIHTHKCFSSCAMKRKIPRATLISGLPGTAQSLVCRPSWAPARLNPRAQSHQREGWLRRVWLPHEAAEQWATLVEKPEIKMG